MRDREFRRKQNEKKSYKKFISEMNRGKLKDLTRSKKRNKNIDFNNLTEEELEELDDDFLAENY
jgi:hypothetical protein